MNEDLKQALERIEKLDPETLKREGRDYEFTDIYLLIKEIYLYIKELHKNEDFLESLPDGRKNTLISDIKSFADIIEQIANFNPQIDNPQATRDSLAGSLKGNYEGLYERLILPIKTHLAEKRSNRTGASRVSKRIEEALVDAQKTRKEISDLLESAKKATAQVGFIEYARIFKNQAKEHKENSRRWLIATIGMLLVTIVYLLYIYSQTVSLITKGEMDSLTTFTLFLAKLFPLAILYYAIYQTVKNYNANMHLYTVNKHRENVLKTFESFVKSSDNPEIKDALLKEAAKAIFFVGDTGYLSLKGAEREGLDLIQIFNDLRKKGTE